MNGRLGRLHCRYRIVGGGPSAGTASRLDRVARERLPEALGDALDQALGADPTVYVLREVRAGVLLGLEDASDAELARRWGDRLGRAVLRAIAADTGDDAEVVRFADDAHHVAEFLLALLDGHPWDHWFHARFLPCRRAGTAGTATAVLFAHREQLSAVLGHLYRRGDLDRLLGLLDDETLRQLWHGGDEGRSGSGDPDPEAARPVFLAVLHLVDRLGLWVEPSPGPEALWRAWLASGARPPDWRDAAELTATFLDVMRLLAHQGRLVPWPPVEHEAFQLRLEAALGELQWLDQAALRTFLPSLLSEPAAGPPVPPRTSSRRSTPRQRELLAALAGLVRAGFRPGPGPLDSPANALRLHTALVTAEPRWQHETLARSLIERLLTAAARSAADGSARSGAAGSLGAPDDADGRLGADGAAVVAALAAGGRLQDPTVGARPTSTPAPGTGTVSTSVLDLTTGLSAGSPTAASSGAAAGAPPASTRGPTAEPLPGPTVGTVPWTGPGAPSASAPGPTTRPVPATTSGAPPGTTAGATPSTLPSATRPHGAAPPLASRVEPAIRTDSAGVFLLVRAAVDARLPALADAAGLPPVGVVLLGLGLRWAGEPALADGRVDPALARLVEAGEPATLPGLRARWQPIDPKRHQRWRAALASRLGSVEDEKSETATLTGGRMGLPDADRSLGLGALLLLRSWARWLRGFSASSTPFLLDAFVRRPGSLVRHGPDLLVRLEPRPLDVVLPFAGYTDELDLTPLYGRGRLRFEVGAP